MLQTMSDRLITREPSRSVPRLDVLHHRCTGPTVFIHQRGPVLSVKCDMQMCSPAVHFRVMVRNEWREEENVVRKCLTWVWCVHRELWTQTSQTSNFIWPQRLTFSFAELINQPLECKQMNCSVTFSAALHFIDGCPDLQSQSMPDLTSYRLKFWAWNMIDKCVAGYILSWCAASSLCNGCAKSFALLGESNPTVE